jgi:TfoX/Sxy family transcriptional regulator of competence genes
VRRGGRLAAAVAGEHDIVGQQRLEPGEVALLGGGEEAAGELLVLVTGCPEARAPLRDVPSRSPRQLVPRMAVVYDEDLADRLRELLASESDVTEQKMFGGLAFLLRGNMAVAASGQGGLLVRVDPATSDSLVATTEARPMEMRGRAMRGWLRVDSDDVRTKRRLAEWVRRGTMYARSLPAKKR